MLSCTVRFNPYENELFLEAALALRKSKLKGPAGRKLLEWDGDLRLINALVRKAQRNKDKFDRI